MPHHHAIMLRAPVRRQHLKLQTTGFVLAVVATGLFTAASVCAPTSVEAQGVLVAEGGLAVQDPTLARAKGLIESQQPEAAISLLRNFLTRSPDSRHLDEAYFLLAVAFVRTEAHDQAVTYLDQLLEEYPSSRLADRARLMLASAHAELGQLDLALPLLAEVRSLSPDPQARRDALALSADLLSRKGDYLRAIQASLEEMSLLPEDERAVPRTRIRDLIRDKLDEKDLRRLRASYPATFPSDLAIIRLIELHLARKEQHLAEKYLRAFLKQFPSHEYATTANALLESFANALKQSEYVLAALLPLSGKLGRFGTESLRGVQLALERGNEMADLPSIALAVQDTESDRVFLRSHLYQLIDDYRPLAIIGPMRSQELRKMAELAERTETTFVTPSATIPDVQQLGRYVFSTAMTYPLQTRRLVEHAMTRLSYYRFAVLYPDTTYGRALARLFGREVMRRGGEIIAIESYQEGDTDFRQPIRRLKEADLKRDGSIAETTTETGQTRLTYTPGFDAVFIPGTAMEVSLILPQLLFYDLSVPLLGTNGWNSPDLLRWGDPSLQGSVFVDGLYLDSSDTNVQDFVARYQRHYRADPSLLAAQAYDATQLVLEAIRRGAGNSRAIRELFMAGHDFPALGGPAAFNAQGVLDRHLFVLEVKDGRIVQAGQLNGELPPGALSPPVGGERVSVQE